GAQAIQARHARVELLARQTAIAPGSELLLGVRFVLEPGWHIYWINPGDSGQPPSLQWQMPDGFSAGEIRWPRPERLQTASQIVDYGYRGDVLLTVPVRVPAFININGVPYLTFALDAKWLICREVCFPDRAKLKLSLRADLPAQANPDTAKMFTDAEKLLPRPLPQGCKASAESKKDAFILIVSSCKAAGEAEFFPLEAGEVENAAPQKVQFRTGKVEITLKKSDLLLKPITTLRGVLVLGETAYRIEAPVRSSLQ
ncbi:MAG TPA: protein-disulfide reductase DsbD domain-containing protein, partial [Alphaproteobacteria bacterium]|nr:protein-disulfide reductase DsbD domain-containing protein [Alphaproteobacteria bacterium]